MKELFERVYIRSEKDLPEKTGFYDVVYKDKGSCPQLNYTESIKGTKEFWLETVDWYLLPVESKEIDINTPFFGNSGATVPVESKSVNLRDELIRFCTELTPAETNKLNWYENIPLVVDNYLADRPSNEVTIKELEDMLTDSTECDDCPFFKAPNEVTDEDIEKWALKVQPARGGYITDYIFSAKAMRDGKIKKQ
jgi:hypothetical protein